MTDKTTVNIDATTLSEMRKVARINKDIYEGSVSAWPAQLIRRLIEANPEPVKIGDWARCEGDSGNAHLIIANLYPEDCDEPLLLGITTLSNRRCGMHAATGSKWRLSIAPAPRIAHLIYRASGRS